MHPALIIFFVIFIIAAISGGGYGLTVFLKHQATTQPSIQPSQPSQPSTEPMIEAPSLLETPIPSVPAPITTETIVSSDVEIPETTTIETVPM